MVRSPQWKSPFLVSATTSQAALPKEPTTWGREERDPSKTAQQRGQKKPGNPQTVLRKLFLRNSSQTELLSKALHFLCIISNNNKTRKNKPESNFEFSRVFGIRVVSFLLLIPKQSS